jgi:hypothetical protein
VRRLAVGDQVHQPHGPRARPGESASTSVSSSGWGPRRPRPSPPVLSTTCP